jgi:hypothetical protein
MTNTTYSKNQPTMNLKRATPREKKTINTHIIYGT